MYKKGFTLIELLIVIGIIAILTAVVIITVAPGERLAEARDATRTKHINALESALYVYAIDNDTYPATITETLTEICNTNLASPSCSGLIDLSATGIIIPVDPQGSDDPNGTGYRVALIEGRLYFDALKSEGTGSSPPVVLSWEVPVGAEAYDKDGNLVISLEETGEINTQEAGMIVFKTAKDYGEITAVPGEYEVLVVAGGGGGGAGYAYTSGSLRKYGGGGGGAGGYLYNSSLNITTNSVVVMVGANGEGATSTGITGLNGGNSTFGTLTSIGGGGGGGAVDTTGNTGGSGGGSGAGNGNIAGGVGTAGPPRQGYNGGIGGITQYSNGYNMTGGAGGGAGGSGSNSQPTSTVSGGIGVTYFGTMYAKGGNAVYSTSNTSGNSGTHYLGNGGDGAYRGSSNGTMPGSRGGSGIIIVRWGDYNHNYDPTQ
jgi:prepilin-type N-terminal cleavage/methylation domain-containing protein